MPYPKPEARKTVKARKRRTNQARRNACIDAVFARDRHCCQKCGVYVFHKREPGCTEFVCGHVHEIVSRSQGGSPFDPTNCILLCNSCHRRVHGLTVKVLE